MQLYLKFLSRKFIFGFILAVGLLSLAALGKGVATLTLGGIFFSEILIILLLPFFHFSFRLFSFKSHFFLMLWVAWSILCAIPFADRYGMEVARDSVIWIYAIFAFYVYSLEISCGGHFLRRLNLFLIFLFVFAPISWITFILSGDSLWINDAHFPIIYVKASDLQIHMTVAFIALTCLVKSTNAKIFYVLIYTPSILTMFAISRGGMVSVFAMLLISALIIPAARRPISFFVFLTIILAVIFIFVGGSQPIALGHHRNISSEQVIDNILSIFGLGTNYTSDYNASWRLNWWKCIIEYIFNGDYFWFGKGFGINLATDDGFQVLEDNSLRSPHSIHMTILARSGFPGFLLWLSFLSCWFLELYNARRKSINFPLPTHEINIPGFMSALAIVGFVGWLINASFDVCIEGPMGGIWFWSIIGFGWGVRREIENRDLCFRSELVRLSH